MLLSKILSVLSLMVAMVVFYVYLYKYYKYIKSMKIRVNRFEELETYQFNPGNMTFRILQAEQLRWNARNFPGAKKHYPLLGMSEEYGELIDSAFPVLMGLSSLGRLSHSHLKMEQGIRGTPEQHMAAKKDAVADIIIYLSDYCNKNNIDLQETVEYTWGQVSKRDWIKFPKNGISE